MSEDLEAVLRRVAAGELTPEEALSALGERPSAATDAAAPAAPSDSAPSPSAGEELPVYGTPPAQPGGPAAAPGEPFPGSESRFAVREPAPTTVRLKTSYRSIQVITDPTVARLHVSGDHTVQQDGDALVISTSGPLDDEQQGENGASGRFSFSDLPRTFAWARAWRDHQLTVRVNPGLALDLDVIGADLKITGPVRALKAHVVASSVRAERLHGPIEVEAFSSSVKLKGAPTETSRIQAESSSVRLSLTREADLTISARNRMGKLILLDQPASQLAFEGESNEVTVGGGRYRLALDAVMSSVTVSNRAWESVA
jgi:hypothetical protein